MTSTDTVTFGGIDVLPVDPTRREALRASGRDHAGNAVEGFVDGEGGWPLRCCLTDSAPGSELAVVAWSPFPWRGPYAEVGPIVIHAHLCDGPAGDGVPAQFLSRHQIARPYGRDRRIAYEHTALVKGDGSLPSVLARQLAIPAIDFVLVRNVLSGCFSFTAQRASATIWS